MTTYFSRLCSTLVGFGLLGILASPGSFAATVFANPFESASICTTSATPTNCDNVQSSTIVKFTAGATGTLQGYFAGGLQSGGSPVGFQNQVGIYLGSSDPTGRNSTSTDASISGVNFACNNNNSTSNFGDKLFGTNCGGITVTAGQTITFVLKANIAGSGCCGGPIDNGTHYVWSDESTTFVSGQTSTTNPNLAFGATYGSPVTNSNTNVTTRSGSIQGTGYNAMAYTTNVALTDTTIGQVTSATGTGVNLTATQLSFNTGTTSCTPGGANARDCINFNSTGAQNLWNSRNGSIGAGNYTFVGFNDWLGGPSNSYFDFAFLFNIKPDTQKVPEPGSVALVLASLLLLYGVRRNEKFAPMIMQAQSV